MLLYFYTVKSFYHDDKIGLRDHRCNVMKFPEGWFSHGFLSCVKLECDVNVNIMEEKINVMKHLNSFIFERSTRL